MRYGHAGVVALWVLASPAVALAAATAPTPAPTVAPDKATTDLNAAWSAMVTVAENAAIMGPGQLRTAKAAQAAMVAWMQAQNAKVTQLSGDLDAANKRVAVLTTDAARARQRIAALTQARDAALAQVRISASSRPAAAPAPPGLRVNH